MNKMNICFCELDFLEKRKLHILSLLIICNGFLNSVIKKLSKYIEKYKCRHFKKHLFLDNFLIFFDLFRIYSVIFSFFLISIPFLLFLETTQFHSIG